MRYRQYTRDELMAVPLGMELRNKLTDRIYTLSEVYYDPIGNVTELTLKEDDGDSSSLVMDYADAYRNFETLEGKPFGKENPFIGQDDWELREHEYEGCSFCKFTSHMKSDLPYDRGCMEADVDTGELALTVKVHLSDNDLCEKLCTELANRVIDVCLDLGKPEQPLNFLVPFPLKEINAE